MNKKILIVGVLIVAILSAGIYFAVSQNRNLPQTVTNVPSEIPVDESSMMTDATTYTSDLVDVTRGPILGVDTLRKSSGEVIVMDSPGNYSLTATFENLPDPKNTDFYEGWLVSSNPVKAISTGRAIKEDGRFVNRFETTDDVSFYTMYVLTLEPDDNNPASAYHILEGTFK